MLQCVALFGSTVSGRMLCAARQQDGSGQLSVGCHGDSGGGLVVGRPGGGLELVGVVSWGAAGCREDRPTVLARVTTLRQWILTNTADSNYCPPPV